MKCTICGASLTFKNGVGICNGCGTTHQLDQAYENTEVFLCYVEHDAQGRRTKDSMIAAEIYQRLEGSEVHTFYERISATDVIGDTLTLLRYQAMFRAKIVLLIGTQADYFEGFLSQYADVLEGKKLIPVYSGLRPEQLPKAIRSLQALNFGAVGAEVDLEKAVLNLLGRYKELQPEMIRAQAKKTKLLLISGLLLLLAAIGAGLFFWLRPPAKPKQPEQPQQQTQQQTPQQIYDDAQQLLAQNHYLEAAALFKTIPDFKNSTAQIKSLYDRYDGYYLSSNDETVSLYINVQNGASAEIEVTKTIDGKQIKFSENPMLETDTATFAFTDNSGNQGTAILTLLNDSIQLQTTVSTAPSIGNNTFTFALSSKTDRPRDAVLTTELLQQWLSRQTTMSDIEQAGFQVKQTWALTGGGGWHDLAHQYDVVNTEVKLILIHFDPKNNCRQGETPPAIEDPYLYGIIAPAELLTPDKVGATHPAYCIEGSITFGMGVDPTDESFSLFPSSLLANYSWNHPYMTATTPTEPLATTDLVAAISEASVGTEAYQLFTYDFESKNHLPLIREQFPTLEPEADAYLAENEDGYLLANAHFDSGLSTFTYFKLNKADGTTEVLLTEEFNEYTDEWHVYSFKSHSELTTEFPDA